MPVRTRSGRLLQKTVDGQLVALPEGATELPLITPGELSRFPIDCEFECFCFDLGNEADREKFRQIMEECGRGYWVKQRIEYQYVPEKQTWLVLLVVGRWYIDVRSDRLPTSSPVPIQTGQSGANQQSVQSETDLFVQPFNPLDLSGINTQ